MENLLNWDEEEVKTLFKFVEIKKSEGVPLIKIFTEYAKCTLRQKNSVRNYYYKQLALFKQNNTLANKLKIDLSKHEVNKGVKFTKREEEKVIQDINQLIENGYSVRKACFKLSNGDVPLMLRYQNKYRSQLKSKENKKPMGQIIKMPAKNESLSEEDIKVLFLGLVRLVKNQERENARLLYEKQIFTANEKLKQVMAELAIKENKIEKLTQKLKLYNSKQSEQKEQIIKERIKSVKSKPSAIKAMSEYFSQKSKANNNSSASI